MGEAEPCRCGGTRQVSVSESIDGNRHVWGVFVHCAGCGYTTQECGDGEMYPRLRAAIIAESGLARLCADPEVNRPLRVRLLAALRRDGRTLAETTGAYALLTGDGITGTPAEMALLGKRLTAAGGTVTVEPV
ncbi:hypothetical protein ACFPIJ_30025 [Dactylosporangium cerinum]|uniref:Uncharacterized protein n=1 Tax=Dactylosporangium cerinum TaxID=1434730 RepID=A0ABV9W4V3_9ACTN